MKWLLVVTLVSGGIETHEMASHPACIERGIDLKIWRMAEHYSCIPDVDKPMGLGTWIAGDQIKGSSETSDGDGSS